MYIHSSWLANQSVGESETTTYKTILFQYYYNKSKKTGMLLKEGGRGQEPLNLSHGFDFAVSCVNQ